MKPKEGKTKVTMALEKIDAKDGSKDKRFLSRRHAEDIHGYSDENIEIGFCEDGAVYFSEADGERFIYLYPEQVQQLKWLLSPGYKSRFKLPLKPRGKDPIKKEAQHGK